MHIPSGGGEGGHTPLKRHQIVLIAVAAVIIGLISAGSVGLGFGSDGSEPDAASNEMLDAITSQPAPVQRPSAPEETSSPEPVVTDEPEPESESAGETPLDQDAYALAEIIEHARDGLGRYPGGVKINDRGVVMFRASAAPKNNQQAHWNDPGYDALETAREFATPYAVAADGQSFSFSIMGPSGRTVVFDSANGGIQP